VATHLFAIPIVWALLMFGFDRVRQCAPTPVSLRSEPRHIGLGDSRGSLFMRAVRFVALVAALVAVAAPASRAQAQSVQITTASSTVRQVFRYTDELPDIANVIVVEVTDPLAAGVCRGGWLDKTDAQFRDVFQMILAAKVAGLRIRLDGDPTRLFEGSSDPYCYLNYVGIL
jgi:hypothetical protein